MAATEKLLGNRYVQLGARRMASQHVKWSVAKILLSLVLMTLSIVTVGQQLDVLIGSGGAFMPLLLVATATIAAVHIILQSLYLYGYFNRHSVPETTTDRGEIDSDDLVKQVLHDSAERSATSIRHGPFGLFPLLAFIFTLLMYLATNF